MGQDLKDILFHRNVTLRPILNNEPFQSQGNNDRRRSLSVSDVPIINLRDLLFHRAIDSIENRIFLGNYQQQQQQQQPPQQPKKQQQQQQQQQLNDSFYEHDLVIDDQS